MSNTVTLNRFDPYITKNIFIHAGCFHADDMLFAAMAIVSAEKAGNNINIIRTNDVPEEDEKSVVGDFGFGVYDHHKSEDKSSIGYSEAKPISACGLLYNDVKEFLFPNDSQTKAVFEALVDVIGHCDNTSDRNTFSDAINLFLPGDDAKMDEHALVAIDFCSAIIRGFVSAHEDELNHKHWRTPRLIKGLFPGVAEKREERYVTCSSQTKNKYKYIGRDEDDKASIKAINAFSVACSVLPAKKRELYENKIRNNDKSQIEAHNKAKAELWPDALSKQKHKTVYLEKYYSYAQHTKDIDTLFVVIPSQRGDYNLYFLKTNNNKYRFDPNLLLDSEGKTFVANDKRFIAFDTKEHALAAAYRGGEAAEKYLTAGGLDAYREIYGGIYDNKYSGDFHRDVIGESIALNMYVKNNIKNINNLSVEDYRHLQVIVADNPYLIHCFCVRFECGEKMKWNFDRPVLSERGVQSEKLWTKTEAGSPWDLGIKDYLKTQSGINLWNKIFPTKNKNKGVYHVQNQ